MTLANANAIPAIDFEGYTLGNINGQFGWMKTGPYDAEVAAVSGFSNASGFGFGTQALRISNSVTSGSFGDQTFSPGVDPAGESLANNHFEASFDIGSTQAAQQPGLFLSVSPDDGNGGRMGYAGFDDQGDGIHVITYDVVDGGPLGTVANWIPFDVATISRTSVHTIKFVIDFVPGPANDVAKLYVDGNLVHTGNTWEDYYRYDPEQNGNGHVVPTTSKLLFRVGGAAAIGTNGNGYLIDNVSLSSSSVFILTIPHIFYPSNYSVVSPSLMNKVDWTDSTGTFLPITYQYQADGDLGYTSSIYLSGWLSASEIPTPGTPQDTYFLRVRAKDSMGNITEWSNGPDNPYVIIVSSSPVTFPSKNDCKNGGWIGFEVFGQQIFANQGTCVSLSVKH